MIGSVLSGEPIAAIGPELSAVVVLTSLSDLALTTREIVAVAEIISWSDDEASRSYIGSHGWATASTDTPPDTMIEGRLRPGRLLTQSIPVQQWGMYGGVLQRDLGQLDIINADGGLDALAERAVDGRLVTIKVGLVAESGSIVREFETDVLGLGGSDTLSLDGTVEGGLGVGSTAVSRVATGRELPPYTSLYVGAVVHADSWEFAPGSLRLTLQDSAADLRRPIQAVLYAGTGGEEGTEDLKDRTKPMAYGRCHQAEPVAVDPVQLIYQISSLPIEAVDAVYDRGVSLTAGAPVTSDVYADLVAAAVTPGQYRVARELGMIKLGSPPDTPVTCDVRGIRLDTRFGPQEPFDDGYYFDDGTGFVESVAGIGYGETLADVIETILYVAGKWTEDRIDTTSMGDLRSGLPYPVGLYIGAGASQTIESVIGELCAGMGVAAGPDRFGRYRAVMLDSPLLGARTGYDMRSLMSIERRSLPWRVPPRAITLGYQRYSRPLGPSEVATGVAASRRDELGREWRIASRDADPIVVTQHPTARATVMIPTPLATREGALAVSERMARLYAPGRKIFSIEVKQLFDVELGETISVIHDRHGLDAGRNCVIVGQSIDLARGMATLEVLG